MALKKGDKVKLLLDALACIHYNADLQCSEFWVKNISEHGVSVVSSQKDVFKSVCYVSRAIPYSKVVKS